MTKFSYWQSYSLQIFVVKRQKQGKLNFFFAIECFPHLFLLKIAFFYFILLNLNQLSFLDEKNNKFDYRSPVHGLFMMPFVLVFCLFLLAWSILVDCVSKNENNLASCFVSQMRSPDLIDTVFICGVMAHENLPKLNVAWILP